MRILVFSFVVGALLISACNDSGDKSISEKVSSTQEQNGTDADFAGLTEKEAEALAEERELNHRVVEREGEMLPVTRDLRPDRLNFVIKGGKVVKVSRG